MATPSKRKREDEVEINNQIYMDYNATTPLAPSVIQVIQETLKDGWGNPSSSYPSGAIAKEAIEIARENIKAMLNANSCDEITFMSGGTEANNHVIWNVMKYFEDWTKDTNNSKRKEENIKESNNKNSPTEYPKYSFKKPHIITSTVEHDSILNVLKSLESDGRVTVSYVGVSEKLGHVDPKDVVAEIREETVLVTIMMANNETGVMQPISEICAEVNKRRPHVEGQLRVLLHTDAAQTIGKVPVDVQELGVNYLTVVGHKFYGPRIGTLWAQEGAPFYPMFFGGGQEKGRRPGTENTCMIAGLGESARLVSKHLNEYQSHFLEVRSYLKERLEETFGSGVVCNCYNDGNLPNTLSVSFSGVNARGREILKQCRKIQASVGAACHTNQGDKPSAVLLAHHVPYVIAATAIRLSVGRNTSRENIDVVVEDLKKTIMELPKS